MYIASDSRYDKMEYNRAGNTGLKLPAISFGFWHNFGKNNTMESMRELLHTCFDNGITHFDLANVYGPENGMAESNFGAILDMDFRPYRDELIISTKAGSDMFAGPYGSRCSRKSVLASLDQSLKRMRLDYVDIFYVHCMDDETPIEETALALDQAVRSGKALYVGVSNYDAAHAAEITKVFKELRTPFVLHQNSFSMINRKIEANGLKQFALENNQGLIVFKPLEQGMLTDKYLNGIPEDSRIRRDGRYLRESSLSEEAMSKVRKLNELAKQRGEKLSDMALAWAYRDPAVTSVLIGASRPQQILDNLNMLNVSAFTQEELDLIEDIQHGRK